MGSKVRRNKKQAKTKTKVVRKNNKLEDDDILKFNDANAEKIESDLFTEMERDLHGTPPTKEEIEDEKRIRREKAKADKEAAKKAKKEEKKKKKEEKKEMKKGNFIVRAAKAVGRWFMAAVNWVKGIFTKKTVVEATVNA